MGRYHKPRVESVSPPIVQASGNDTVRITGRHLEFVSALRIGITYLASFQRLNSHAINFVMPGMNPGAIEITVVSRRNHLSSGSITVVSLENSTPAITSTHPFLDIIENPCASPAFYPERKFTLVGQNFSSLDVWIDGVKVEKVFLDSAHIEVVRPFQDCRILRASRNAFAPRDGVTDALGDVATSATLAGVTLFQGIYDLFIHGFIFRVGSSLPFQLLSSQVSPDAPCPSTAAVTVQTIPANNVCRQK